MCKILVFKKGNNTFNQTQMMTKQKINHKNLSHLHSAKYIQIMALSGIIMNMFLRTYKLINKIVLMERRPPNGISLVLPLHTKLSKITVYGNTNKTPNNYYLLKKCRQNPGILYTHCSPAFM